MFKEIEEPIKITSEEQIKVVKQVENSIEEIKPAVSHIETIKQEDKPAETVNPNKQITEIAQEKEKV